MTKQVRLMYFGQVHHESRFSRSVANPPPSLRRQGPARHHPESAQAKSSPLSQGPPVAQVAADLGLGGLLHLAPPALPPVAAAQAPGEVDAEEAQLVRAGHAGVAVEAGVQAGQV